MNRVSVILLCITTLAIFFILKEKPSIDIKKYEDRISEMQDLITGLEVANDSLENESHQLEIQLASFDQKIKNLNKEVNVIKRETKAKLDSIDKFGDDELEKFFSDRYYSKASNSN